MLYICSMKEENDKILTRNSVMMSGLYVAYINGTSYFEEYLRTLKQQERNNKIDKLLNLDI